MDYIRNRLSEKSTWFSLAAGVPAAAVFPAPWSFIAIGMTAVGVFLPEKAK